MKQINNLVRKISLLFILVVAICEINLTYAQSESSEKLFTLKKYEEVLPILLKEADDGRARAFGMLARMYGNGWGVKQDLEKSYLWTLKGVQQNDPESMYVMGYMNENGIHLEKNIEDAELWFLKAAENGYERAYEKLGYFYGGEILEKKNLDKAEKWIKKSAELGMPYDQYRLGYLYCCGFEENKQNYNESEKWLKIADSNGEMNATGLLGKLYVYGFLNTKPNFLKAVPYVEKAYKFNKEEYAGTMDRIYTQVLSDSVNFYDEEIKLKARKFYDDLRVEGNYYWYKNQAAMYSGGRDRPTNKQLSFEYSVLAFEKLLFSKINKTSYEHEYKQNIVIIGSTFRQFQKRESIGGELEFAWLHKSMLKHQETINSDIDIYPGSKQNLMDSINNRMMEIKNETSSLDEQFLKKIEVKELLKISLDFIKNRRNKFGYIEADDLISEGWKYYLGDERSINEPLAYRLMEEALKLSIMTKDKLAIATARNNLGAIASSSINVHVRNNKMALVHLKDGFDSQYAPQNLLWHEFFGEIKLSAEERSNLLERFKLNNLADHPVKYLDSTLIKDYSDLRAIANFLNRQAGENINDVYLRNGFCHFLLENIDFFGVDQVRGCFRKLETQIAVVIEKWIEIKQYDIIKLMSLKDECLKYVAKLDKIQRGEYVSDMPNTSNLLAQLFPDVTRGLSGSEISITKNTPTKSGYKGYYALVIGNSDYINKKLKNPVNDATSITNKLKSFGFIIKKLTNLNSKQLKKSIFEFQVEAKDAEIIVVFYAGHGVQIGGVNYLLPVDVDLDKGAEQVISIGYSVNDLKNNLPGRTKLIFLDACRNNPFKFTSQRGIQNEGLAPINNIPSGVLISFSTKDGGIALDAPVNSITSSNSPYTSALVNNLSKEQDIVFILRQVRSDVMSATNNKQEPWEYSNLNSGELVISKLKRQK